MPGPELCVVIPVHDGEATVGRAVASVAAQAGVSVEVVVVDDGSADRSAEVAEGWGPPVRVLRRRQGGVAVARNAGAAASSAPFLAFLDADDEVEPGWASTLVAAAGQAGVGVACCAVRRRDEDGPSKVVPPRPMGPAFGGITASFLAGSFVLRRSVFDHAGGYLPGLRFGENFELGLRIGRALAALDLRVATVAEPLAVWNHRRARRHHPLAVLDSAELVLRRHADLLARDPVLLADHRAVAGVNAARVGDLATARRHLAAAARARPSLRAAGRAAAALVPPLARWAWPPAGGALPRLAAPSAHHPGELPTATVVVACRDAGDDLLDQVRAVAPQLAAGRSELILADDGSSDGSVDRALALGLPLVRSVGAAGRRGPSPARNAGARAGTGQVLVFLDHDDRAGPGCVDAMRRALADHAAARGDGPGDGLFPARRGGALGIDRALFEALGGFDEDLSAAEDVDLCLRLEERYDAGLASVPGATLGHRLPGGAGAALRQGRAYGRSGPELYLRHRRFGMRPDPLGSVVRRWAALLRAGRSPDPGRRMEALFGIGASAGRLEGSARHLVWYP